jgi:beta-glucosidase
MSLPPSPRHLQAKRRLATFASVGFVGFVGFVGPAFVGCAPEPRVQVAAPTPPPSLAPAASTAAPPPPPVAATPQERADALLAQMTASEKIDYLGGDRGFYIRPIARLGIPEIKMSDGPSGCRNWGPSTVYPAAVALAATFDTALVERVGHAIGRDCRQRGVHILLAPGVNIARSPLGGRNFEYMGEDPLLAGKTAAAYVRGVQGEGVLATVKHFAGNNQEWNRRGTSSEIDERTLREIYLPAFERAVREGHVAGVMTAYNPLNGTYCSQNAWLLRDVLKTQWGFAGMVMSDWHAVTDAAGAVNAGLDLEMPDARYMNRDTLAPLLAAHVVDPTAIDDKVRRILRTIAEAGFIGGAPQKRDDIPADDPSSVAVSLEAARRSVVLLKNGGGLLPLDRAKIKRIAVIGPNATPAVFGGSGSAFVTPFHTVALLDAIKSRAAQSGEGPALDVTYHPGVRQPTDMGILGRACFDGPVRREVFAGRELAGNAVESGAVDRIDMSLDREPPPAPALGKENFSIRWTGTALAPKAGKYRIVTNTDDGVRVFLDQKKVIDDWREHSQRTNETAVDLGAGPHAVVVEYFQGTGGATAQFGFGPVATAAAAFEGAAEVAALAQRADVVIVSVGFGQSADTNSANAHFEPFWPPPWARKGGLVEAEDTDRPFALPPAQIETIRVVESANPHAVVVVNAGGAVDLSAFLDRTPALLWAWYPGQEGGRALADVLFGDVDPSGRLPVTFAKRYADYPSAPYYNLDEAHKTPYTEGVFVGYRGFDAHRVQPAFPFGFGLSYTTFDMSDVRVASADDGSVQVTVRVTNRGKRAGDEAVEVYVAPAPVAKASSGVAVARPPKELKAFARAALAPGESRDITLNLEPRAFAFWDIQRQQWSVVAGTYDVLVGASSADIRAHHTVDMTARLLPP